jgi:hypothetical protein
MTEEKEYKYAEIAGFEDYLIYEDGRVFNKKRRRYLRLTLGCNGYLFIHLCKQGIRKSFNIHRLLAQYFVANPEMKTHVDHIDGNKENNSLENLRWATRAENNRNARKGKNNTSGEKNVTWFKRDSKWRVQFNIGGKNRHFGYFSNYDDAIKFARQKRREFHGDFACDE